MGDVNILFRMKWNKDNTCAKKRKFTFCFSKTESVLNQIFISLFYLFFKRTSKIPCIFWLLYYFLMHFIEGHIWFYEFCTYWNITAYICFWLENPLMYKFIFTFANFFWILFVPYYCTFLRFRATDLYKMKLS